MSGRQGPWLLRDKLSERRRAAERKRESECTSYIYAAVVAGNGCSCSCCTHVFLLLSLIISIALGFLFYFYFFVLASPSRLRRRDWPWPRLPSFLNVLHALKLKVPNDLMDFESVSCRWFRPYSQWKFRGNQGSSFIWILFWFQIIFPLRRAVNDSLIYQGVARALLDRFQKVYSSIYIY
jgi:hypothetical protein